MSGLRFACDPDGPNTCASGFGCVRAEPGHSYKGVCVRVEDADVRMDSSPADPSVTTPEDTADSSRDDGWGDHPEAGFSDPGGDVQDLLDSNHDADKVTETEIEVEAVLDTESQVEVAADGSPDDLGTDEEVEVECVPFYLGDDRPFAEDLAVSDDVTPADPGSPQDPSVEAGSLSGQIRVVPALIDFGFWSAGSTVEIPFSVQNLGPGALRLDRFTLKGDPWFSLLVGYDPKATADTVVYEVQPPILLKAGSTFNGKVRFESIQQKEAYAEMRVFSSDPAYPDGYPVHILANQKLPCLAFAPESLDFGAQVVGDTADLEVRLDACGEKTLVVSSIEVPPEATLAGFSLGYEKFPLGQPPTPAAPLNLEPGESVTLRVLYAPQGPSPKDASGLPIPAEYEVVVHDNTFTGSSFLPVRGFAVEERCAMPVIRVAEGSPVPAGTLLHLSGLSSYSPFGAITTYRWSVSQPEGNHGTLLPSSEAAEPAFLVGVPGTYVFALEVDDANASGSCKTATATIEGTASDAAVFVLTWRPVSPITPAPPFFGPDVDLHFLHPNAKGVDADQDGQPDGYYDLPWDCFWFNPTPNWDNLQPTAWYNDDANLIYDNPDGSGPEVVVMGLKCAAANVYRVGVHFFDDHGYGPVDATLQAFVAGEPVFEASERLTSLDLWDAARFHCGDRTVTGVPGPVIKHNYVNPSFVVPP